MQHLDKEHLIPGIYPVADAFAGTAATDIVECMSAVGVVFDIVKGVGTTGTSTITVLACDDTTPSNSTAVAFMYRASTTPDFSLANLATSSTSITSDILPPQ